MRRNAQRAAGIGSEREDDGTAGNGDRGARRRAAGDIVEIPGIFRRAVHRVVARRLIGQLGHRRAADAARAGAIEQIEHLGLLRSVHRQRLRQSTMRLACLGHEHVLRRIGHPVEDALGWRRWRLRTRRMPSIAHRARGRIRRPAPKSVRAPRHQVRPSREIASSLFCRWNGPGPDRLVLRLEGRDLLAIALASGRHHPSR